MRLSRAARGRLEWIIFWEKNRKDASLTARHFGTSRIAEPVTLRDVFQTKQKATPSVTFCLTQFKFGLGVCRAISLTGGDCLLPDFQICLRGLAIPVAHQEQSSIPVLQFRERSLTVPYDTPYVNPTSVFGLHSI